MRIVNIIAYILVIVGAVNWGLFGLFNFNLVSSVFAGARTAGSIIVYTVIALAALNILALAFTVVKGGIEYLIESEFYFANGFSLAFSGYPIIVEKVGTWLRIYSAAHFAIARLLALMLGIFALVKRSVDFGRLGVFAVIASLVLSVLYMTHGIIAYSVLCNLLTPFIRITSVPAPLILAPILLKKLAKSTT